MTFSGREALLDLFHASLLCSLLFSTEVFLFQLDVCTCMYESLENGHLRPLTALLLCRYTLIESQQLAFQTTC